MSHWKAIVMLVAILCCFVPAVPAAAAPVDPFKDACEINKKATVESEACKVSGADPITGPNGTIAKVTRLLAYITGIAAIILMIIGGIMYILSGGDSSKVSAAKNTVLYAAIGLIIVIMAQAIIVFILNNVVTPKE